MVRHLERENRAVAARGWEEGTGSCCSRGMERQFCEVDRLTTRCVSLTLWYHAPESAEDGGLCQARLGSGTSSVYY